MLSLVHGQQLPDHLARSGDFRRHPTDDPINVKINEFKQISYIAKGSFGHVYLTRLNREKLEVAQKICKFQDRWQPLERDVSLEPWYRELTFHQTSSHQHIVYLHGFITIMSDGNNPARPKALHLFLELMTCSFREILNCMSYSYFETDNDSPFKAEGSVRVEPFRAFLRHVCSGLIYLHDRHYMHRDLKPGNILLKAEGGTAVVKLADFGTIKVRQQIILIWIMGVPI